MAREFRVITTGTDLSVPDADWEMLDAGELDEDETLATLRDHARAQNAVLALVEDLDGELAPIVIMRVDAAWNILEIKGEPQGFFVEPRDDLPLVALVSSSIDAGIGQPCPATTFVRRRESGWFSESWQLFPHPWIVRTGRAWCWRGARVSFGAHRLTIHCGASTTAIDDFLSALAPMPYDRVDATAYNVRPELKEDQSIKIRDGELSWIRRSGAPRPQLATFDAGVLHAIADGALGTIDWLAWEHDWETPVALGDDGASLADYLAGDEDRVEAEQAQRLKLHHLNAEGLTQADLVEKLSMLLGASRPVSDKDFDAWLAKLVLADVPRYVSIQVAGPPDELFARLSRCQRRIVWRVSGHG